jgi:hypothetical protein
MRIVIAASMVTAIALIAAGVLSVAGAETSTSSPVASGDTPVRAVSVEGVASEPIAQSASAAQATAVYRQGMAAAVLDGQAKAQFLTSNAGATLGPVQSIAEGGGYITCPDEVEYQGEQPDFGSASGPSVVAGTRLPARPVASGAPSAKGPAHHKRRKAKKASASSCMLSTQVSISYALS